MRKLTLKRWGLFATSIICLMVLVYHMPPVHRRFSWRIDFALTYLRGMIDPVQPLPTSLPQPHVSVTNYPTQSPTEEFASHVAAFATAKTPTLPPTPAASPTPLPAEIDLPAPAYEKQDINNCGPASLSMYMNFYGWKGSQFDIANLLKPERDDRNVNVDELAYYVRTQAGWLNIEYRVGGNLALLKKLLANGIPVMVEKSFYFETPYWPNDDLWAAHYLLLTGYNDKTQLFKGQDSYYGANKEISYQTLDEHWQTFNRVYILVFLPTQSETIKAILGSDWDVSANRQHALEAAQSETQTDPKNASAWFNAGSNLVYFERYQEAADAYDKARELGLPQRMLRYQFGPFIAYFHTGQIAELETLTEYALKRTPNAEEALLWHGWALYRKGEIDGAMADFRKALEKNPNYQDAQYALEFLISSQ